LFLKSSADVDVVMISQKSLSRQIDVMLYFSCGAFHA